MYTITTMALWDQHIKEEDTKCVAVSAQREGFFNIGSGRSVKKYDRVFPGIFFTFGYFRVFRVFPGMSGIFGYFWVYPYILGLFSNIQWGLKRLQQNQTGFR